MTAIAPDSNQLRELDADTREAWRAYSDGLTGLSGPEYDRAESEHWDELQAELRRLEQRRELLSRTSS